MGILKDLIYGSIMFTTGYFVGLVTDSDKIVEHLHIEQKARQPYKTIDDRVQNPGEPNLAPYRSIDGQIAKKEDNCFNTVGDYTSLALRKD